MLLFYNGLPPLQNVILALTFSAIQAKADTFANSVE